MVAYLIYDFLIKHQNVVFIAHKSKANIKAEYNNRNGESEN